MKTVSILKYDCEAHQFCPSFVIEDDLQDSDNECAFDQVLITPSEAWMDEYLQWNRFGRLPEDPAEDNLLSLDEDDPTTSIPVFYSLEELHDFNAKGAELTRRLQVELEQGNPSQCKIRVGVYRPLYTNMLVGPVASWWHLKDCNYDFVVPVQRLPISDHIKSRLQAFRFHKGMGLWQDPEALLGLVEEGKDLQRGLYLELTAGTAAAGEDTMDQREETQDCCAQRTSWEAQEELRCKTRVLAECSSSFGPYHLVLGSRSSTNLLVV